MGRVKAFITASNEHRSVSIGGRRLNTVVEATLNTDNASNSDCAMSVSASVHDRDDGGDSTMFFVDLPGEQAEGWGANIRLDGCNFPSTSRRDKLPVKGVFADYRRLYEHLDHIYLPGGDPLAHALACVAYCESHGLAHSEKLDVGDDGLPRKRRSIIRD